MMENSLNQINRCIYSPWAIGLFWVMQIQAASVKNRHLSFFQIVLSPSETVISKTPEQNT